jgi:hypothetical protein
MMTSTADHGLDADSMGLDAASKDMEDVEDYNDECAEQPHSLEKDGLTTTPSPRVSKRCFLFLGIFTVIVVLLVVLRVTGNTNEVPTPAVATTVTSDADANTNSDPVTPTSSSPTSPRPQGCVFSDRFDNEQNYHNNQLFPGQFICSKNHTNNGAENERYRFGLTLEGELVLQDTLLPESSTYQYDRVLYSNDYSNILDGSYYFSLQTDGTFAIHGRTLNQLEWSVVPNRQMHWTEQCLEEHDCPYLHLHPGGVLVVNYIDNDDQWQQKNVLHLYDF